MQHPTFSGIRIRSARDANILFHAVALNLLPLITRRLDEAERLQVQPGSVYVWEERNLSYFESNGQEMKRFTEGRSWGPSKARDEFLFYYEKENGVKSQMVERMKAGPKSRAQLVKQTYSVNVHSNDSTQVKKWHLNAYYCADTVEELATVDHISMLNSLVVPHELYTCARTSRAREAAIRSQTTAYATTERNVSSPYSYPHPHHYSDDEEFHSYSIPSSASGTTSSSDEGSPPVTPVTSRACLAPLEYLENLPRMGRHPMDDHALRLFDSVQPFQKSSPLYD